MRKRDEVIAESERKAQPNRHLLEILLDIRALLAKLVKEKE